MLTINTYYPLTHTCLEFNLTVNKGEIVGLYGHSGSGKTTFLRQIAGLSIPKKGQITFDDSVWTNKGKLITSIQDRKTGFVFQDYGLFPHLTALENIEISKQQLSTDVIEALQLTPFLHQKPNTLSGGQKQRTAIARALNCKANLLLLDEPFSALDDDMKATTIQLLKKYQQESATTTLVVSHDITALKQLCTTIYTLKEKDGFTKLVHAYV